jgi:hypothetical protein
MPFVELALISSELYPFLKALTVTTVLEERRYLLRARLLHLHVLPVEPYVVAHKIQYG